MSLANPRKTMEILRKYAFKPSKALGQNFLIDANILAKIIEIAALKPSDVVLEVGAGIGTLTEALAQEVRTVIAVEFDRVLVSILRDTLQNYDNVWLLHSHAMKLNLDTLPPGLPQPNKFVSNVPYNIATPLLATFLTHYPQIGNYVVMVQKEVAERLAAKPSTKEYGSISLKVRYYCEVEIVEPRISRRVFMPPPNVDSAIIKLTRLPRPRVEVEDEEQLFNIVSAAFSQRRKTLGNALMSLPQFAGGKRELEDVLRAANIDGRRRGETLNLEEFATISHFLKVGRYGQKP